MKYNNKKIIFFTNTITFLTLFFSPITSKIKAFTNPVLTGDLGGGTATAAENASSGVAFVSYFVKVWNALITVGALIVLVNFLWGSLEWILAGGDSGKIEKARNRITQSMIGIIILVSSFVIIGFISHLFFGEEFSILNLEFSAPGETTVVPPPGGGGLAP